MIPWRIRNALKPLQFKVGWMLLNPAQPSGSVLRWLHGGWSNEGWSGDTAYLEAVWRASLKARRVLECGSGLSTLLLGKVAQTTGAEIWSLEHIPEWQKRVTDVLQQNQLHNRVVYAPLRSYGEFDWYTLPPDLPADFDLVVCDGPPSTTKGGRYGLVPVCANRIATATILLDDVDRLEEQAIVRRWETEFGFAGPTRTVGDGAFSVLVRTPAAM